MPKRLPERWQPECIREFRAAARQRYNDGLALAGQGRRTGAVYLWGYSAEIRTRTLDVHVRRLRKKLGGYADQYIETIFGIGYRFQPFHAPRFFSHHVVKPAIALGA